MDDRTALEQQMIRPEVQKMMQQMPKKKTDVITADSQLIMLIVLKEHIINSIFWNMLIDMLESEVKSRGFRFLLCVVDEEGSPSIEIADSYILLGKLPAKYLNMVSCTHKPMVWIDGESRYNSINQVRVNNCYGAYQITKKAIELGHKRLAFILSASHLSYKERYKGFMDCVAEFQDKGVTCELVQLDESREEDSLKQLLSQKDIPTFILTCTDPLAHVIYMVAEKLLIDIPGSLSVAGFDNIHESRFLDPPLSSVDVPRMDMAIAAIELLVKHMNNPLCPHELIQVEPALVIRKSLAKPKY